jgi:hypothetical protein
VDEPELVDLLLQFGDRLLEVEEGLLHGGSRAVTGSRIIRVSAGR